MQFGVSVTGVAGQRQRRFDPGTRIPPRRYVFVSSAKARQAKGKAQPQRYEETAAELDTHDPH
jgi:hypothetical protein